MPSRQESRSPLRFCALQVWQPMKCCTKLTCALPGKGAQKVPEQA